MSQFQPIETLSLIIVQLLIENMLVQFHGVLVNFILTFYSNACCRNINFSGDVRGMILIQFELVSQPFLFYLLVANMINVVLCSHKFLAIFPLGIFCLVA